MEFWDPPLGSGSTTTPTPPEGSGQAVGWGYHLDLAAVSKRKEDLVLAFTAERMRQRGKPGARGRLS